jgi:hypothetical protein
MQPARLARRASCIFLLTTRSTRRPKIHAEHLEARALFICVLERRPVVVIRGVEDEDVDARVEDGRVGAQTPAAAGGGVGVVQGARWRPQ